MASHYKAFISYCHQDERWAAWLQKSLERYRIPNRLRKLHPDLPKRLNPVFRDREELASSTDLSESIHDALSRSKALLLVCSPAAAASRWVSEEIRGFRKLAPNAPILCLMVDGNPDRTAPDCAFPQVLLNDPSGKPLPEPLAADVRINADGKHGAILKMVAGLLGVGIDELRQRDMQRRNRVMAGFVSGALIIALTTTILAVNAVKSRNESELRRAQAEDLIDFMLVDLREQLEPVGQLHILDAVGQEAMAYFQALGSMGTDEELLSRAMALRQIGEVRVNQGNLEAGLESFVGSRKLTETLVSRYPGNLNYLFELGQAEFWVGYVAWERGELDAVLIAMTRYKEISQSLNLQAPDNPTFQMELTFSDQNLAALALEQGEPKIALEHIRAAVNNQRELLRHYPNNREYALVLANALSWLGSTYRDQGWLKAATDPYQEGQEIILRLHNTGNSSVDAAALCDMTLMLAEAKNQLGQDAEAFEQFETASILYRSLAENDPDNAIWREGLARSYSGMGVTSMGLGNFKSAKDWLEESLVLLNALSEQDDSNTVFALRLAKAHSWLATVASKSGLPESANQHSSAALAVLGEVTFDSPPGVISVLRAAIILDQVGAVIAAQGDTQRAVELWLKGTRQLSMASLESPQNKSIYVRLMHRLDRSEEVTDLYAEVLASELKLPHLLPIPPE